MPSSLSTRKRRYSRQRCKSMRKQNKICVKTNG
nr:MAG TPA: hypothetical protein [Caudoviricetes sp.]